MFGMKRFSGKRGGEFIAVDMCSNFLKIVYFKAAAKRKEVYSIYAENITGLSDEDISKKISEYFVKDKIRTRDVIDIISPHLVITKNIEVPSTNPREISDIINLQAGRHTPYSREEIIVDYVEIGTFKHNYTKILMIILTKNVVKRHMDILNNAGLKLDRVLFSPEGIAISTANLLRTKNDDFPVGIVNVDEGSSDFIVIFKNKVLFVRAIPIGTKHIIADRERYQTRFADELKKSLEAYHTEDIQKTPNLLLLSGAIKELKELEGVLNNILHIPVSLVTYFKNVNISKRALDSISEFSQLTFLNIIAPSIVVDLSKVDLIPEEVKLRKAFEERGRELIKTGIFCLTIFILVCLILMGKIYFKSIYLQQLNQKYIELNNEAKKLEKNFVKVRIMRNYLTNRGYSLEVLNELYKIAPLDMRFNDIRYFNRERFTIMGTAESMATVFSFVDSLKKSRYFEDVKTRYTTKRKEDGRDVADFEIVSMLAKEIKR